MASTQLPVQLELGGSFLRNKAKRALSLTTHLQLLSRSRKQGTLYHSSMA
jgi:hypothetical protein